MICIRRCTPDPAWLGTANGLSRIAGIVEVGEALAQYAERFEHPGWKAAREL